MRVLVTGASGYLGRYVAERFARSHEVTGTYGTVDAPITGCELVRLDLSQPETLAELIRKVSPELIVHCAAIARPDMCEKNRELARVVNVEASESAARAANDVGARLFYISTDLVFDGENPPYTEKAAANPLSYYAEKKLEGERRVRAICSKTTVLRLSLLYGWKKEGPPSFNDFIYENLKKGQRVKLFRDQNRSALYADDAAEMIERLALIEGDAGAVDGIFHLAGPTSLSRLRFGEIFCDTFGFDRCLIEPIAMADMPSLIERPKDCSLDGSRLFKSLGFTPRSVAEAFRKMLSLVP